MKNMRSIFKITMIVLMLCLFVATPVFADISMSFPSGGTAISNVTTSAKKVWGTVTTIVQILAFAAIVFAGVRYMFASADQKADIVDAANEII